MKAPTEHGCSIMAQPDRTVRTMIGNFSAVRLSAHVVPGAAMAARVHDSAQEIS